MAGVGKKIKKNISWIQWIVPTVLFAVFMTFSLGSYYNGALEKAKQDVIKEFSEQMSFYSGQYDVAYFYCRSMAQSAADFCEAHSEDMFSDQNVELMQNICKNYSYNKGYIIKPDYTAIDTTKRMYTDISTSGVFSKLSFVSAEITDFYVDESGKAISYVSAPIKTEDQVLGLVVFEYVPESIKDVVDTPNYISSNVYALISADGVIADRAGLEGAFMERGSNLYDKFSTYEFIESSPEQMKSALSKGSGGYVVAKLNANNIRYFFYKPVGELGTFFVMSVNSGMIKNKIDNNSQDAWTLTLRTLIVMAVFIVFLVAVLIMNLAKNTRANKELINKAQTDLLTDLLNKKATEEKIKEYLAEDGKDKTSMMFILDIDNFKNINDTMGHAFGDEVIATLGKQLRAEFRVNDIVGRTGGDEFTIFLKDLKDDNLLKSEANRVLGIFKNFKVGEYTKYFATASIGVSIYPQDADSFEGLYKAADQALYKAKNRGKNQMAFYKED
ncbi:MAG: GGDEF domain-containing protein [Lachnospiraceae bacterium]|nr:GGDEF domain-containing protein [Lachnospiraceae bacterium]